MTNLVGKMRDQAAKIDIRLSEQHYNPGGSNVASKLLKEAAKEIERLEDNYEKMFKQALAETLMKNRQLAVMAWAAETQTLKTIYAALHDEDKLDDLFELWENRND